MIVRRIQLAPAAAAFMTDNSAEHFPRETGGILIGRVESDTAYVITAVGPGPLAQHGTADFLRDGDYAQERLEVLVAESPRPITYLGEWHSHPQPHGASGRDWTSMLWISRSPAYQCSDPLLIICLRSRRGHWGFRSYQWCGIGLVEVRLEIVED